MEVCGGQTHAIVRWGLQQLLPPGVRLIHGPGCPVCVTPAVTLAAALALAQERGVILASYGDMLRVPAAAATDPHLPPPTLLTARAAGADVRLLTSPLQALALARAEPSRQVVVLAVGFETTAPATALLVRHVLAEGITNLSLLNAHVRVGPAMQAIAADPASAVQGFLAAGHVAAVLGTSELVALRRRRQPVVVSGFEPLQLLQALEACITLLERGQTAVANAYPQVVRAAGNPWARALLQDVFAAADGVWRGLGVIPGGVLSLRPAYRALDARHRFGLPDPLEAIDPRDAAFCGADAPGANPGDAPSCAPCSHPASTSGVLACPTRSSSALGSAGLRAGRSPEPTPTPLPSRSITPTSTRFPASSSAAAADPCISGAILRGLATPPDCPWFGSTCTPLTPLGAPMVSSEGACAAYHRYR